VTTDNRQFIAGHVSPWMVDGLFPHDDQPRPDISGTIEVRPVVYEDHGNSCVAGRRGDDVTPDFWSVYVRGTDGMAQCVADMPNALAADCIADALVAAYSPALRASCDAFQPITRHSYAETAVCIWDAIRDMREGSRDNAVSLNIDGTFEAIGTAAVRSAAMGWIDAIETAWMRLDDDSIAFDFEFVPDWIMSNVDWSDWRGPAVRPAPLQPVTAADRLDPALSFLTVDLGAEIVAMGGNCEAVRYNGPIGSYVLVTASDGVCLPTVSDWMVGVYHVEGDIAAHVFSSDGDGERGVTLENAVTGACALLPTRLPVMAPGDKIEMWDQREKLGEEAPIDIAVELAEIVEALAIADVRSDATAHATALRDGVALLNRIGISVPTKD